MGDSRSTSFNTYRFEWGYMARQFKIVAKHGATQKEWYRDEVVHLDNVMKCFNKDENDKADNHLYIPYTNLRFVEETG